MSDPAVALVLNDTGESVETTLVPPLSSTSGWWALACGTIAVFAPPAIGGALGTAVGAALGVCALGLVVRLAQYWKLRCNPLKIVISRELFGCEFDAQTWTLDAIVGFGSLDPEVGLTIRFRGTRRWSVPLACPPEHARQLVLRLEEYRAANTRFWLDEIRSGRLGDEASLQRLIGGSP